jgi:large subunit ribosomal protein L18
MKNITKSTSARRKKRVSANIVGSKERPRIAIYRSNSYIYAQAIDDEARITLVSYSSIKLAKKDAKLNKSDEARQVGVQLAKLLQEKKILKGVYDRSRFAYNGRVKALAEGLREGGLQI